MVSNSVSPVKTRMVICFSWAVSVFQDGMSLDTGTFSGNQKLPVNRSHTSASFSSCRRFQLIAETGSISFIPSDTRTPFRRRSRFADFGSMSPPGRLRATPTLPLGCDNVRNRDMLCWRVASGTEEFVLRRLELAGGQPVLPRHPAPQRPVHSVLVEIPAPATPGVPHRAGQFALQLRVVSVRRGTRRRQRLRTRPVHRSDRLRR